MAESVLPAAQPASARCTSCETELAPHALACPRCRALVHSDRLKELATIAEQRQQAGDVHGALEAWHGALRLLPPDSTQFAAISKHISETTSALARDAAPATKAAPKEGPAWKRGFAGVGAVVLVALGKLKFLLLGLTKLSTFASMFAFFGVYWNLYGWPLALGLVISIYIHEMGHVMEIRKLGIDAGAPLFIPGLGAVVMLKQHVDDPVVDAKIGLAGPVWGTLAGLAAFGVYFATHSLVWAAIAQLTGWINLFNLIPIWQLDGSRAFHALSRGGRLAIVGVAVLLFFITDQKMLLAVAAVGAYRAFTPAESESNNSIMLTFALLLATLSGLSAVHPLR